MWKPAISESCADAVPILLEKLEKSDNMQLIRLQFADRKLKLLVVKLLIIPFILHAICCPTRPQSPFHLAPCRALYEGNWERVRYVV